MPRTHASSLAAARVACCPLCGGRCTATVATREESAREIALRDAFFRRRFAHPARRDADIRDVFHVALTTPAPLLRCERCDLFVRDGADDASTAFAEDPYDVRTLDSLRRFHAEEFAKKSWVRELLPSGARVLEVGSYAGGFLETARSWGWTVTGLDIGRDTSAFTRAAGDDVESASLDDAAFEARSFDGVFIWNCFEQLPDPARALARSAELLRDRGVLLLRVPDAEVYALRRGDSAYLAYSNLLGFPHRYGFTERSLTAACIAAGFTRESLRRGPAMRPHRESMHEWAQREEAALAPAAWIEAVFRK